MQKLALMAQISTTLKDYDVEKSLYKELDLEIPTMLNEDALHHLQF